VKIKMLRFETAGVGPRALFPAEERPLKYGPPMVLVSPPPPPPPLSIKANFPMILPNWFYLALDLP